MRDGRQQISLKTKLPGIEIIFLIRAQNFLIDVRECRISLERRQGPGGRLRLAKRNTSLSSATRLSFPNALRTLCQLLAHREKNGRTRGNFFVGGTNMAM